MSTTAPARVGVPAGLTPHLTLSSERLRLAMLWLTGLMGAFVFVEPSPYEFVSLLTILTFVATSLSLSAPIMPLALILIFYNVGFGIAVQPVLDKAQVLTWVLVSCYLSMTSVFFAAMLGVNTQQRMTRLMQGYSAAAVVASVGAIIGYFHLLGGHSDMLLLYGRARATFNDPNVLGAFLILPAIMAFQRVLAARFVDALRAGLLLLLILAALFLTFSRGAWGQFAFAAVTTMALLFITSQSTSERLRIAVMAAVGLLVIVAFIAALLSINQIDELFKERAALEQSYDVGHWGRFGRHILGFLLALDRPFGIGPLQFHNFFPEDPHNVYLNAFMSGGWLSGFAYLTLTALSLVMGLRFLLVATPWRPTYQAVYAAYVGVVGESVIIDSDHWRHYYLLLGALWGLMAASRPYLIVSRPSPAAQTGVARTPVATLAPASPAA